MNKPFSKSILLDRGLWPKKSFGQNFMVDQRKNALFAEAVLSLNQDKLRPVVEIGAGFGSLTSHLLAVSPIVHAIERDRDLVPILREQFAEQIKAGHLIIHEADAKKFDLTSVFDQKNRGILVGNLPYHLTSSILLLALHYRFVLEGAVFLVQKEVANRLLAGANTRDYGFLTVILKLAFLIERIAQVSKTSFWPVPKVDSTIIKMTPTDNGISRVSDIDAFMVFVRTIFQQRRKKLSTILSTKFSKNTLIDLGINPDLRPENLEPNQFVDMFLAMERPHA